MSICWYCHWGWPKEVADIYNKYSEMLKDNSYTAMRYGPAHIVWEDENFESDNIQWCIDNAQEFRHNLSDEEVALVVLSLEELLTIPEEVRCCIPEDYDDEHPENYPPREGIIMARERD